MEKSEVVSIFTTLATKAGRRRNYSYHWTSVRDGQMYTHQLRADDPVPLRGYNHRPVFCKIMLFS